jgi:hypothetical protein
MAISAKIRKVSKMLAALRGGARDGFPQALQIYPGRVDRERVWQRWPRLTLFPSTIRAGFAG